MAVSPSTDNAVGPKNASVSPLEIEDVEPAKPTVRDVGQEHGFSEKEQNRILWHVDRRLVLTCGFIYCISLMDRTNLGIAVIAGMKVDLDLIGTRYNIITLVFFPTYTLLMPLANVMLKRFGARAFLPTITLLWGINTMGMGLIRTWVQAIPLRVLMGVFEAGCFPGCAYLLSCWYTRYELQKRNAAFYMVGILSQAFSGILGYAFIQMEGLGGGVSWMGRHSTTEPGVYGPGLAGWRWIFIMQGIITIVIAFIAYFTIVNFPETATKTFGLKFLNEKEASWIVARINQDRADVEAEKFSWKRFFAHAGDVKSWGFGVIFMCTSCITYSIAYFLPIILRDGMGFSVGAAQCLIAPPQVFSMIFMFGFAYLGDKYHLRSPILITCGICALVGLALLGFAKNVGARYFGVFLACISCNANIPALMTWQANNVRGQWKRAFSSALMVAAGGLGGVIGSTVFRSQDAPAYVPGIVTCMLCGGINLATATALVLHFYRANKQADAGKRIIEGLEGFRYTL